MVSVETLHSVLLGSPSPVLWLGGGASVKSGIPLSEDLVKKAARWEYCRSQGLLFGDPGVRPSDWMPMLKNYPWYKQDALAENLPLVMRHLLQPRDNRREFFRSILDVNVPPSIGYERLAEFMASKIVTTVLTTNFDQVLHDLCHRRRRPHHVEFIDSPSTYKLLTTSPRYPQIIHLYGSVESYIDCFEEAQMKKLESALVARLIPMLRDHPLIVIGYSGSEETMMRHFLVEHIEAVEHFHQGVYWCSHNHQSKDDLHPLVREFACLIPGNFQIVGIEGFDELLGRFWALHQKQQPRPTMVSVPNLPVDERAYAPTFDMEHVESSFENEFDWANMQARLVNYCQEMEDPVPSVVKRDWVLEQLCKYDLATKCDDGQILPTYAGYLLFGRRPQERLAASKIQLQVGGEDRWIEGNLWNQLSAITDALAEVNRPFLLKGDKSETVFPYPPTALREISVNALVHRDYDSDRYVTIEIELDKIRITNPGGLVEEVMQQTKDGSLQRQIEQGKRGIKGYRNPVIADLFSSSHDMEKKGSGLADVHRLVNENGSKVTFDPVQQNTAFEVVIHARPEAVDKQTGTAAVVVSTRYATNLLEVLEVPDKVWQAPAPYSRVKDVWAGTDVAWLPPFILHNHNIHTFFDLREKANPLCELVDKKKVGCLPISKFAADQDGERRLVWLMNECLYQHLKTRELIFDRYRKRAYFPRTKEGNRAVSYQARLRRSTRTVTKQIISPTTQKVRYWEHQSFSFSFERFADTWVLQILPGYVFTRDGEFDHLAGERVNILSTKRESRDYNSKVHTDLVFWAWVLSDGEPGGFALQPGPEYEELALADLSLPRFRLSSSLPSVSLYYLEEISEKDELENARDLAEMAEIEEELSALAEEFDEEPEE